MKFEAGEIALVAFDAGGDISPRTNEEVTVKRVGPLGMFEPTSGRTHPAVIGCSPYPSDYEIVDSRGYHWHCLETSLKKKNPPDEDRSDQIPARVRNLFKVGEPA